MHYFDRIIKLDNNHVIEDIYNTKATLPNPHFLFSNFSNQPKNNYKISNTSINNLSWEIFNVYDEPLLEGTIYNYIRGYGTHFISVFFSIITLFLFGLLMLRQELLFKCLFVAGYFVIGLLAFRIYVAVEMFEHKRYCPLKKEEIKKLQIIGVLPKDINQIFKKTLLFNFDKLEIIG
ncbi:MAG: hypothetical protein ACQBVK_01800 [Candidatus Phytoplasma sp. TWB_XP]